MRNLWKSVLGLWVIGMGFGVSAPAQADSVGPYYATPSWDQTLPAATRFIVLSNFGGAAVLDRETGLVWEKSPATTTHTWSLARFQCMSRTTGGRKGWRLPSVHELGSLVDPANSNPALPTGHPFTNVQSAVYWSATTSAEFPTTNAGYVTFDSGIEGGNGFKGNAYHAWCARGGMNADQY